MFRPESIPRAKKALIRLEVSIRAKSKISVFNLIVVSILD